MIARTVAYTGLTLLLLGSDQFCKWLGVSGRVHYLPNHAFMFLDQFQVTMATRLFLYWIGAFVFGFLLWYLLYIFKVGAGYQIIIFTLFAGGIVSNLIDWTLRGYVVDYLPIFGRVYNLADLYIALGSGLILPALGERFFTDDLKDLS